MDNFNRERKHDLSQYGIFDVSENLDDVVESADEEDFEAELAAITAGHVKPNQRKQEPKRSVSPTKLEQMIAESMREIGSDEELSGDDDDPDILNELIEITGVDEETTPRNETRRDEMPSAENSTEPIMSTTTTNTVQLLMDRIEMYKLAEKLAKESGENTKARSRARGIKTLESMLKQAIAGETINSNDIPPPVSTKTVDRSIKIIEASSSPTNEINLPKAINLPTNQIETNLSEQTPSTVEKMISEKDDSKLNILLNRQKEYKIAALTAKKAGDTVTALQYVRIIKIFDAVIATAKNGEPIDLSDMPPPPNELSADMLQAIGKSNITPELKKQDELKQESTAEADPKSAALQNDLSLNTPKTILEALTQRLQKYQANEANAKAEGNDSKARRNGRIVKQYLDAIKMYKAGKSIAFDELPTPPGYPPFPGQENLTEVPSDKNDREPPETPRTPQSPSKKGDSKINDNHPTTSLMNKTIAILIERQKDFKEAALHAKRAGEIDQAKEYLKTYKGIENLLNVAKGGLPVDLTTLPISPKQRQELENTFESIDDAEDGMKSTNVKDVYSKLEKQLQNQLRKCKEWSAHHRALGDVTSTHRFENLAIDVQKDLDIIMLCRDKGSEVPKFNFEQKNFNIIRCNTDLAETEMEIEIIRGISYNVSKPKDVDTYVKLEFPYPQENPFRRKTNVIYNTDNPEYNEKFIAEIQPKTRAGQRVFKRQGVKIEVYQKGGFFRSDTLIGVVNVKLQPLESTCEIHDSFDIMNGRKACGKIEVKIRTRNPIHSKQVVIENVKWLVLQ